MGPLQQLVKDHKQETQVPRFETIEEIWTDLEEKEENFSLQRQKEMSKTEKVEQSTKP